MKNTFVLLAALLVFVSCAANTAFAQRKELTVVYTANCNGKLKACGCPGDPFGGFSERVTLINELREKEKPFLLLDSGNMVGLFGDYDLKASCVARMMNMMQYDAAAAGRNEMYNGVTKALDISKIAKFPLISSTIIDAGKKKRIFPPFVLKKIDDVTVAVLAVVDSTAFINTEAKTYDYDVLPAEKAVREALAQLTERADFVVLLSQMDYYKNKEMLAAFPEIDLIVEGYGNRKYEPPMTETGGIIVSPGGRGEFVGLITLEKNVETVSIKRSELIPLIGIEEDNKAHEIVLEYYRKRI